MDADDARMREIFLPQVLKSTENCKNTLHTNNRLLDRQFRNNDRFVFKPSGKAALIRELK
jgi:hypothetical protein